MLFYYGLKQNRGVTYHGFPIIEARIPAATMLSLRLAVTPFCQIKRWGQHQGVLKLSRLVACAGIGAHRPY